jgi:excisionase family DNA binding protein
VFSGIAKSRIQIMEKFMAPKSKDGIIISPVGLIFTTEQIGSILQCHRRTVERLIACGELQAIHVGRRLRVTAQQLQAFITQQGTTDTPATPVANEQPV